MFPAIKLHYLGVDTRYQKRRYGEYLLIKVTEVCDDILKNSGCNFLSLEALNDSVGFYSHYGFITVGEPKVDLTEDFEKIILTDMVLKLGEL